MSLTFGLGARIDNPSEFEERIRNICQSFNYAAAFNIEAVESDVREGVALAYQHFNWNLVLAIRAPSSYRANLAPAIDEELTQFEESGQRPAFFSFLQQASDVLRDIQGDHKLLFFADEWSRDCTPRFSHGDVGRLIEILSLPGHWYQRRYDFSTSTEKNVSDDPFLYEYHK